jgi:AraC-like DNA-binding protein
MSLFYREIKPSADVAPLVVSFWEFTVGDGNFAPVQHEIFPDGCVSLFYHRNNQAGIKNIFLNGLNLESIITPVFPNDIFWGMRISPAACAGILQINPTVFRIERRLAADKFPHLTDGLLEKLNDSQDFEEAITVYENRLKNLGENPDLVDKKVARAIELIEQTSGEIKIAEIAERLNLSPRQLERRFKASSGLSPKQFARTRRFRATAVGLVENDNFNWANRAAEMGFTDQAHLTREFVSVTKRSPNSFAKKVSQIKHGNLVK